MFTSRRAPNFVTQMLVIFITIQGSCCRSDVIVGHTVLSAYTDVMTYSGAPGGRTLSFSGQLVDGSGVAVNGVRDLQFTMWDSSTSTSLGSILHTETVTATIQNGAVSYQLGINSPLASSAFDGYNGTNRFLEVSVNGDSAGRMGLNNSGVVLDGSSIAFRNATSLSAYTDTQAYSGAPGGRTLSFSGLLVDSNGAAIKGSHNVQFSLWDDPVSMSPGSVLHTETINTNILDGVLSHQLGTGIPLSSAVFENYDGTNRFLEVSVDGEAIGRMALNNSGQVLNGSTFALREATTISAYTDVLTYSGSPGGRTLSFSGLLLDDSGLPVNGHRDLQFTLWEDAISTSPLSMLYSEAFSATLQNGVVSYQLGLSTPFSSSIFDGYNGTNRFLELSVGGEPTGRFLLNSSSPFASAAVPEPSSFALLSCVCVAIGGSRLRRNARQKQRTELQAEPMAKPLRPQRGP